MGNLILLITTLLGFIALILVPILIYKNKKIRQNLEQLQDAKHELDDFLLHFSNSLSTSDGLKEAINSICQHLAEQISCEAVAIYENIDGQLIADGVYGAYTLIPSSNQKLLSNQRFLEEAVKLCKFTVGDGSFVGDIAKNQKGEVLKDGSLDDRFANTLNPGSICGVIGEVLMCDNVVYGVIVLLNNRKNLIAPFEKHQIERLAHVTPQIVLMHQLVRSYSDMNKRERIDQELEFARQIQCSLLPSSFPKWEQFSIHAFTRPAKEVNGDFYDFVKIDDDRLLIVIGDACGKGVPACMLSAMTRSFIRALADKFTTLGCFLVELNDKIYSDTDDGRFITVNCCLLDKKNSLLEFGRAGHTELITFVHNHLRVIYPDGAALGILPSEYSNFDTFCLAFEYGMSFLVFSDGITEAVNATEEEFGLERLKVLFQDSLQKGYDANKVISTILDEVQEFSPAQIDDQTLILIQYA